MERSVELKMNMRGFQSIKLKRRVSQIYHYCAKQIVKSICKQVSVSIGLETTSLEDVNLQKSKLSLVFLAEKN